MGTISKINGVTAATISSVGSVLSSNVSSFNGQTYPSATFRVYHGSYSGTGSTGNAVTGVGFTPSTVIIKDSANTDPASAVIAWSGLGGGTAYGVGLSAFGPTNNIVTSYDAGGFTLGDPAADTNMGFNTSGKTYYFTAIKGESTVLKVGNYTGNSTDNRSITGLGFDPDFVIIRRRDSAPSSGAVPFRFRSNDADQCHVNTDSAVNTNRIQNFVTDGFQLGNNVAVNTTGTYDYLAFKIPTGGGETGTYTGTGSALTVNLVDSSVTPTVVFVKDRSSVGGLALLMAGSAGGNTANLISAVANKTQQITSIGTGSFDIGTDAVANTNTNIFDYMVLKTI